MAVNKIMVASRLRRQASRLSLDARAVVEQELRQLADMLEQTKTHNTNKR